MTASPLPDDAHVLIRDAYQYWLRIHPAPDRLPGRQHFDPLDIPHLLPHVWLVDVIRGAPPRFRYRIVGTALDHSMGRSLSGQMLDDVIPNFYTAPALSAPYIAMLTEPRPAYRKGAPIFAHNRQFRMIERLLLPLARDGVAPDILFCVTLFYLPDGTVIGSTT
ncbi:PAS domain-containing protein [Ferrovibrio terrae]|uniref:PAS domain-containing protein n=1 Tax=Ferrovibrio terrae TaxID=2594003 RepID=UPI003137A08B